jgi:hypothetical protein
MALGAIRGPFSLHAMTAERSVGTGASSSSEGIAFVLAGLLGVRARPGGAAPTSGQTALVHESESGGVVSRFYSHIEHVFKSFVSRDRMRRSEGRSLLPHVRTWTQRKEAPRWVDMGRLTASGSTPHSATTISTHPHRPRRHGGPGSPIGRVRRAWSSSRSSRHPSRARLRPLWGRQMARLCREGHGSTGLSWAALPETCRSRS